MSPQSLPIICEEPRPTVGQPALVGVNQSKSQPEGSPTVTSRNFAPAYAPSVANWIASVSRRDQDKDLVCDDVDNCPGAPNPSQRNSNELAEDTWGNATYGDACDPAPSPSSHLDETSFSQVGTVSVVQGNELVDYKVGRSIRDDLRLEPILEAGNSLISSGVQPRYCDCRDPLTGEGIADPAVCADQTLGFGCIIDPRQASSAYTEVGPQFADLNQNATAWWRVRTSASPGGTSTEADFAANYAGEGQPPSPNVVRKWDYLADYAEWFSNGWINAGTASSTFGAGTDLAGALWFHDPTARGANAHGLGGLGALYSSIADTFRYNIAPDRGVYQESSSRLWVFWKFTFCPPMCGLEWPGQTLVNPPIFTASPEAQELTRWRGTTGTVERSLVSSALLDRSLTPGIVGVASDAPPGMFSDKGLRDGTTTFSGTPADQAYPRGLLAWHNEGDPAAGVEASVSLAAVHLSQALKQEYSIVDEDLSGSDTTSALLASLRAAEHVAATYSPFADTLFMVHGAADGEGRVFARSAPRPGQNDASAWRMTDTLETGAITSQATMVFSPTDRLLWYLLTFQWVGLGSGGSSTMPPQQR